MRDIPPTLAALVVWLVIVSALFGFGYALVPHEGPRVQPQQKADSPLEKQKEAQSHQGPAQPPTVNGIAPKADDKTERDAKAGTEEGTEFWPPFGGYRLKATDSLLALFTLGLLGIGLWQGIQLRRTVTTTKELIEATIGLEMPKLRVSDAFIGPQHSRRFNWLTKDSQRERLRTGRVEIHVTNYGKTPAFIKDWLIVLYATDYGLPREPIYAGNWANDRDLEMPIIAPNGGTGSLVTDPAARPPLTEDQISSVLTLGGDLLLIYGVIGFEDYEGRRWARGFALRWERNGLNDEGEGCLTFNEAAYNYQSLAKPPSEWWWFRRKTLRRIHTLKMWIRRHFG